VPSRDGQDNPCSCKIGLKLAEPMNRHADITDDSLQAVTVLLERDSKEHSQDLADESLFGEEWAARHNQEIWGTGPSGMYEASPPPL